MRVESSGFQILLQEIVLVLYMFASRVEKDVFGDGAKEIRETLLITPCLRV